jgi:hypothetical protein
MKPPLAVLLLGCCCAQERPELGWFVDRAGALRRLEGVSGAPQAGPPVARQVRAHARGQGWLAWSTDTEFCLLADDESTPACRGLESGFPLLRFAPAGFPLRAWDGARFHDLATPDSAWRECPACPYAEDVLLDFELDAGGGMRVLQETAAGLRIVRYGAAGVWLDATDLEGVRAPALLDPGGWVAAADFGQAGPGGWVAATDHGLAGPGGWRWPGLAPGALRLAARGLWNAWDEEGPALLAPARRQTSRISAEERR